MRRLSMVLAAAVASALIIVAVAALDAVGADKSPAPGKDDLAGRFAQCLRDRGAAVPALSGVQLERWLKTHEPPLATARACKTALAGIAAPDVRSSGNADAKKIATCLRAHGLTPPTAPDDLKRWILGHRDDAAVSRALEECGMGPPPSCGDKEGQGSAAAQGGKDGQT